MARKIYLEDISLDEALSRLFTELEKEKTWGHLPAELVSLEKAFGRITAQPIWAKISSPHYHAAAMDGVAVNAEDTYGATKTSPKILKIGTQAHWVDTGAQVPLDCNAVIMVEDVQTLANDEIEIQAAAAPWQHVRPLGEDIVATELVLPENHKIRPQDIGAMAAAGLTEVPVRTKPRIGIIPTGSELVEPGNTPAPGKIIEFNSLMLAGQIEEWDAQAQRYPIVPDELEKIISAIKRALESCDIVIINAGSSAGSKDYTSTAIENLGELLVHGIAIRPGHPAVLGIAQGKPVIGIPGYPVSALLTTELIIKPLVGRLLSYSPPAQPRVKAVMTRKLLSPIGQEEFVRVTLGRVGDRMVSTPLSRGAGVIMSLVRADGILRVPRFSEGVNSGEVVEVELRRPIEEVENTILAIGSHDLALDLLASLLHKYYPLRRLSSAHVGSMGGLLALKHGEAHIAGTHLLDEATGEYNISYIKDVLKGEETVLINLTYREQGLIVPVGNPKGITSLNNFTREDITFVNRQRGSGTRVLLDFKLKQSGLDPSNIKGYEREEYTHTGVAAAVSSGVADVGLGILAAAKALGLDFLPLLKERYDLAIPKTFYDSDLLKPLLEIIRGKEFQDIVSSLGGYDISETGRVIAIIK